MTERRIALVLAGGVSLGSFEAGALTELLWALEALNREGGERRFVLDVMSGGSAGGITAALVARAMLYDLPGRRRNLFRAWVEETDLVRFLEGAPPNALISKRALGEIAAELLTDPPFEATAPASFAPRPGETLELGLSLSNMSGIDYSVPYFPSQEGRFVSTFFTDRASISLDPAALPDRDGWEGIARTAIASGNFPLAFRPESLGRTPEDYPGADETDLLPGMLAFEDGGIFDNEPLGAALRLARKIDGGTISPERSIILVDPTLNRTSQETVAPDGDLLDHGLRLLVMIFGESRARDWLRAHRVNNQLYWRDGLVGVLATLCRATELAPEGSFRQELDRQALAVAEEKKRLFPERYPAPEAYLQECLEEIRRRYADTVDAVGEPPDGAERRAVFERLLFLLNQTASLQSKDVIEPVLIGSTPEQTAGDELSGFAGFFVREWREHDFRQGRLEARRILPGVLGDYPREPDVPDYTIPAGWEGFPSVGLQDAPVGVRKQLRDRLTDRVIGALEQRIPLPLRWVARRFVVRPAVEDLLEL